MMAPWIMRTGVLVAATCLFAGQPPSGPFEIECRCPIQVRGGTMLKIETQGKVRTFTRQGMHWIVVEGTGARTDGDASRRAALCRRAQPRGRH